MCWMDGWTDVDRWISGWVGEWVDGWCWDQIMCIWSRRPPLLSPLSERYIETVATHWIHTFFFSSLDFSSWLRFFCLMGLCARLSVYFWCFVERKNNNKLLLALFLLAHSVVRPAAEFSSATRSLSLSLSLTDTRDFPRLWNSVYVRSVRRSKLFWAVRRFWTHRKSWKFWDLFIERTGSVLISLLIGLICWLPKVSLNIINQWVNQPYSGFLIEK